MNFSKNQFKYIPIVERRPEQTNLPFNDPEVQAWLMSCSRIIFDTGLVTKFAESRRALLEIRGAEWFKKPPGDDFVVECIERAISAEAPFAIHCSTNLYGTEETTLRLVKVDSSGQVLGGSLSQVAILDAKSQACLMLGDSIYSGYTNEDLKIVQALAKEQSSLPWTPEINPDHLVTSR